MKKEEEKQEEKEQVRRRLEVLDARRRSLECESEAIVSELLGPPVPPPSANQQQQQQLPHVIVPPMGIDTPLVDNEGYPRNDIDVMRARTLRNRLVTIRTDHQSLMKEIDQQLEQLAGLLQPKPAEGGGGGGVLPPSESGEQRTNMELAARAAPKPKPKFDPATGKWVVRNWDGSIAGTGHDDQHKGRKFDDLSSEWMPGHTTATTTTTAVAVPSLSRNSSNNVAATTAAAATATATITTNNNDLMTMIVHHPAAELPTSAGATALVSSTSLSSPPLPRRPLARVDHVEPGSPAANAGLCVDDRIWSFGPIYGTMDGIGELVQRAAAARQRIGLRVQRRCDTPPPDRESSSHNNGGGGDGGIVVDRLQQEQFLLLVLAPQPWSGRGFLGCHIVPVAN